MIKVNDKIDILTPSTVGCDDAPVFDASQVLDSFESCEECTRICWRLENCENPKDVVYASSLYQNFTVYTGKVISIIHPSTGEEVCVSVTQVLCRNINYDFIFITVIDCFDDCETCLFVPPPEEYDFSQRSVYPGYNTPACSTEVYDKTKCKWSESLYQDMASRRYGIDFCCDPSEQKWHIKNELLDLAAIYDPEVCASKEPPPPTPQCDKVCYTTNECMPLYKISAYLTIGAETCGLDLYEYYLAQDQQGQAQIQSIGDCFLTQEVCYPQSSDPSQCVELLQTIRNYIDECQNQVQQNYAEIEQSPALLPSTTTWYQDYLVCHSQLSMIIANFQKSASRQGECPEHMLDNLTFTYNRCSDNAVSNVNVIAAREGFEITSGSTVTISNPSWGATEALFTTYMLPLFTQSESCDTPPPPPPCDCLTYQFYNLNGEGDATISDTKDCSGKLLSITVPPISAVQLCMKSADFDSGTYQGFTEIQPSGTECCDPEAVYPPCCKRMYIYGGGNGGQFSYTTCDGNLDVVSLNALEWGTIFIDLCQTYEVTGTVIITPNGPA